VVTGRGLRGGWLVSIDQTDGIVTFAVVAEIAVC
jgi:hypothetical protein